MDAPRYDPTQTAAHAPASCAGRAQPGKFFARRNMLLGIAGAVTGIVGAAYLDLFPKNSFIGFSSMFLRSPMDHHPLSLIHQ